MLIWRNRFHDAVVCKNPAVTEGRCKRDELLGTIEQDLKSIQKRIVR